MSFIDLHSHLAWDIDDGIENKENAWIALQEAKKQNIERIVATPHLIPGTTTTKEFEIIKNRINELKELAKQLDITIYSGSEIMLNSDYLTVLKNHQFLFINNGPYVLVEFNVTVPLCSDYDEKLYEFSLKHKLVIAHVERYFNHKIDLDIIRNWVDRGFIIQINSNSLLGIYGDVIKNNAYDLLNNGLVHVISNDTHRCTGRRSVNLKQTYDLLMKKYEQEDLNKLMYDNPLLIIEGKSPSLIKIRKLSKLSWFKRRK